MVTGGHETGIHSWIHELDSILLPEGGRDLRMRAAFHYQRALTPEPGP